MRIVANGETIEVSADLTVLDLINARGLTGKPVAVEVNKQLVPKKQHAAHRLRAGDVVEIVTFVGGG